MDSSGVKTLRLKNVKKDVKKELQTSSYIMLPLPQKEKMLTLMVVRNHSLWGREQNQLVEVASEEVASENKLKDKKVTDIFHKEALSVFLCASPTMHSGFFRGSLLHTGGGPPWQMYSVLLGSCLSSNGGDWPRTTWATI